MLRPYRLWSCWGMSTTDCRLLGGFGIRATLSRGRSPRQTEYSRADSRRQHKPRAGAMPGLVAPASTPSPLHLAVLPPPSVLHCRPGRASQLAWPGLSAPGLSNRLSPPRHTDLHHDSPDHARWRSKGHASRGSTSRLRGREVTPAELAGQIAWGALWCACYPASGPRVHVSLAPPHPFSEPAGSLRMPLRAFRVSFVTPVLPRSPLHLPPTPAIIPSTGDDGDE